MNPQTILYAITIIGGAALAIYTTYREYQNAYTYGDPERPRNRPNSTSQSRRDRKRKYKSNRKTDDCCICLSTMESGDLFVIECNHMFHERCIIDWLKEKRVCPICRAPV